MFRSEIFLSGVKMSTILDINESGIDPQAEVRKLQDLVKKLETQNEVLRQKQKLPTNDLNMIENSEVLKHAVNNSVFYNTRKHIEKHDVAITESEDLENVDIIDVNKQIPDDEESWLYKSPRPPTPQQHRVSPYKYIRQDLDNPSPDVQSAKRSLKYKLEEVARMSRSSSTPAFQSFTTPQSSSLAMSLSADSTPIKPTIKPSVAPKSDGNVKTGTFTRPKKNKASPVTLSTVEKTKENVETIHHTNVADIENLAKLQEESLRQSIAQTSPRRDATFRRNSHNSVESDNSSPPDSPYGSSQQLHVHSPGGVQNFRGSAPNISRLKPRAQHYNSDSSLADYQTEEPAESNAETPKYTRFQSSLARPSSPNVSGLKLPRNMRGNSPQRSGLPTPRRIPQPGSNPTQKSPRLQAPKRISGLPAPRSSQAKPKDESWREGCF